jgi:hypothetical protein
VVRRMHAEGFMHACMHVCMCTEDIVSFVTRGEKSS